MDTVFNYGQAFRKKPVVIEAAQWTGSVYSADKVIAWAIERGCPAGMKYDHGYGLTVPSLEGAMTASPGDWIIRGVKGEFYPCKPDIFEATYEAVVP